MKSKTKTKTRRIYYGPDGDETSMWWTVIVKSAPHPVMVNGTVAHAITGKAGVTIGCAMSNMVRENAKKFSHAVYLAAFTKTTALLVDSKNKDGSPRSAYLYHHSYKFIVENNDKRTLKRMVRANPEIMEREFTLRPPTFPRVGSGKGSGQTPPERQYKTGHAKPFLPRGALGRAVAAGQIGEHVARQLQQVADRT